MTNFTLKTRVTLIFPIAITAVLACLLLFMHFMLQSYIKSSISGHQYLMVSLLADDIDQSVTENLETLAVIAGRVNRKLVENPGLALKYLQSQSEHLKYFDNGLYLFDRNGRIIAETPQGLARTGQDYSYREYLQQTIATRKPFVSDPYESSQQHHHPVISFSVPIFDGDGSLLAVLSGSLDLIRSSLIDKLSRVKLTKGGYVYLYNLDRMMISHPDKSRIMKRDVPPGANRLFDLAIQGFEGTDETVTSRGLRTLSSFKHLKTRNWIIAANYPLAEAYAPLNRFRVVFLFVIPLVSLAIFLGMRRHLRRITDPVINLTRHVESVGQKNGPERMFNLQGCDEVAILGQAFNGLVLENDRQREELLSELEQRKRIDMHLKRQNEYLQALHETTVGLISRHDFSSLLKAIVVRAGKLVETEHCFVYLKNAANTEMEMVFQSGIYEHLAHYPIVPGQGMVGLVWESGEPYTVDDYSSWEGRLQDPGRDVLHAAACVPLKAGDDVVGALGLAFVEPEYCFDDDRMKQLTAFGELASLALENARLNDESRRELLERRKVEEHLRKLSVAVEQSPISIIITDSSGNIEYVNPHFTLLTGYNSDEVVGRNPGILKSGETSRDEYRQLWETILSGRQWCGEFHNRKKDGELYWEQALIAPIRDENGNTTNFIGIQEDITERKQLENQLRHAQKMEAVGQLAGGIAHDFNNILTAIIGYSSIIQLKLPENSPLIKNAEQIVATAERGSKLTQGLLAFSRKQATDMHLIDFNRVVVRVEQLLLRLISENIRLELELAHYSLPVMADSALIEQVLMNLATNARDAMPDGGAIRICTEAISIDNDFITARGFGKPGDYVRLTFADDGEGMDEEVSKHVFEPFYTTKQLGKGTGLGLSIVYGIVKKHNGYIVCLSEPGRGTVFELYFPTAAGTPVREAPRQENGIPTGSASEVILIAEDDSETRLITKGILEEFGYLVLESGNGLDALELFKCNLGRINLVILDVIMPDMGGREVFDAIRLLQPSMKVLFCSGYSDDLVSSQLETGTGAYYLAKPFSPKDLLMKIREVLDNER